MIGGTEFNRRIRNLLWSGALLGVAITSLVFLILTVVAVALWPIWVGIPLFVGMVHATRPIAGLVARWSGRRLGRPVARPRRPLPPGFHARFRAMVADGSTWRDLAWVLVNGTAGLAVSIVSLVESILELVFAWLPPGMLLRLHAWVSYAMLVPDRKQQLEQRVEQLTESRARTVDASAAELRRIERDLHDGAQARLVALALNLGMAEDELDRDPDSARQLIAEAREASSTALAEIRDLVRGIHPPVLADRGLGGAVQALALSVPIPVSVDDRLDGRLPAPVESAAYFAIAEAMANVIKHSGAPAATITLARQEDVLTAVVTDHGSGGADASRGTGLRGIERRLSAFDGTLEVNSPPGGPTVLTIVVPCASSSPKTSPFSGTG